jgi:hypothetical protein
MAKRKVGSQNANLIPDHYWLGIALNYVRVGGVQHIFEKLSIRLIIFFKPHLNRRFEQEVMGLQSFGSPNFGNFETLNLEVLGKMTFRCSPRG